MSTAAVTNDQATRAQGISTLLEVVIESADNFDADLMDQDEHLTLVNLKDNLELANYWNMRLMQSLGGGE